MDETLQGMINYIEERMKSFGNVSICMPLPKTLERKLSKHFNIKRELFGYVHFTNKIEGK